MYRFVDQDEVLAALTILGPSPGNVERRAFRSLRTRIRRNSLSDGLLRLEQDKSLPPDLSARVHDLVWQTLAQLAGVTRPATRRPSDLHDQIAQLDIELYLLISDRLERVLHRAEHLAQVHVTAAARTPDAVGDPA